MADPNYRPHPQYRKALERALRIMKHMLESEGLPSDQIVIGIIAAHPGGPQEGVDIMVDYDPPDAVRAMMSFNVIGDKMERDLASAAADVLIEALVEAATQQAAAERAQNN